MKDKTVIVAGAGKSGIASVGLLLRNGANVILYDQNTEIVLNHQSTDAFLGGMTL